MLHKSSWRNSSWKNRDTYKGYNHILWTVKVWGRNHTSYIHTSARTSTRDNRRGSLLPTPTHFKKGALRNIFKTLGSKFIAGGDYNSKHIQWGSRLTTAKDRELSKVLQEQNHSFLSTGSPTCWPTDANKIPDLLDFFITNGISTTYVEIQASYDLTSDHTPIIATLSTNVTVRQPPPQLHTTQTNWETYRNLVRDKVNLAIKLKDSEEVERAIDPFISVAVTQLKKPLQPGTPNAQPTTYPVKLRDSWPQNEKPGPPGKKPTHKTVDD
jgi:hypothetical protein